MSAPILRGPRVTLRPPKDQDADDRLRCGRDAEYVRSVGGDYRTIQSLTADEAQLWLEQCRAEPVGWMNEVDGRCNGAARLHSLNETDRRARYAIGIFDPSARNQGYGAEATRLILDYAFGALELHRVDLRVLAHNARAIACYTKCGFMREGIEREGAFIAGEWQSDVMMSILEHEYRQSSAHTETVMPQTREP